MFQPFTEKARRTIFFEASAFGSRTIEAEHLLLGILRAFRGTKWCAGWDRAAGDDRGLMDRYVAHCEDILAEMVSFGHPA